MLKKCLMAGGLVWLPIIATIWVIQFVVNLLNKLVDVLPPDYRPRNIFWYPYSWPRYHYCDYYRIRHRFVSDQFFRR